MCVCVCGGVGRVSCLCAFEFVRCVRGVFDCGCVHVLVSGGACVDMCECVCLGVWVSGCECGYVCVCMGRWV